MSRKFLNTNDLASRCLLAVLLLVGPVWDVAISRTSAWIVAECGEVKPEDIFYHRHEAGEAEHWHTHHDTSAQQRRSNGNESNEPSFASYDEALHDHPMLVMSSVAALTRLSASDLHSGALANQVVACSRAAFPTVVVAVSCPRGPPFCLGQRFLHVSV